MSSRRPKKLFKAWLSLLGEVYPMTHDLTELLEKLKVRQPDAARFDALIDYAPYAVQLRYGGRDAQAETLDRGEALAQAESLLKSVKRRSGDAEGV